MHNLWKICLLFLLLIGSAQCSVLLRLQRQATTPNSFEEATTPNSVEEETDEASQTSDASCGEFEDEESRRVAQRAEQAAEYFPEPLSRERTKEVLKRALEILEKKDTPRKRRCGSYNVDQDAVNALRFLTGDEEIGSTTDDSSHNNPSATSPQQSEAFCPEDTITTVKADPVPLEKIKKIVEWHDKGWSEAGIRRRASWFRRQYLKKYRQRLARSDGKCQYKDIDEHVAKKANEALAAHYQART